MTFPSMDVLKLEVERAPLAGELVNMVANPSGQYGAWGWRTPVGGSSMTTTSDGNLKYVHAVSVANHCYTESYEVTVGQWVGASWVMQTATYGGGIPASYEATIEYLAGPDGVVLSTKVSAMLQDDPATQYIDPFVVPAGVTHARLRFDFYRDSLRNPITTAGATLKFHAATLVAAATSAGLSTVSRRNLITNPSFEVNTTGWNARHNCAISTSTARAVVGTRSLAVTAQAPGGAGDTVTEVVVGTDSGTSAFGVTAGQTYAVLASAWITATTTYARARMRWYDAAGNRVGSDFEVTSETGTGVAAWRSGTGYTTVPAGATRAEVQVRIFDPEVGIAHGTVFNVDAVLFEERATFDAAGGTYFDGDTADIGTQQLYAWVGTAHASQSTLTTYVPYTDGQWKDILAPSHELGISRHALDVGTLTATVISDDLDPAASSDVRPGRRIRVLAKDNGSGDFERLFEGKIDNSKVTYVKGTRIFLTASDNVAQLANSSQNQGMGTINDLRFILEGAGVPWNVNGSGAQIGSATLVSINNNASVLDQIAVTRDSVLGYAWVDRNNVLQAWDAANMPATPVGTFDEAVYSDLDVSFNTETAINDVRIRWLRLEGSETTEVVYGPYTDTDSIKTWGHHSAEFTMQGAAEDAAAIGAQAVAILTANATPVIRINSVDVPIRAASDITTAKALVDLYDLVTVSYAPTLTTDSSRITSIEHRITPTSWTMHLGFEVDGAVASPRSTPSPTTSAPAVDTEWHTVGAAGEPAYENSWTASNDGTLFRLLGNGLLAIALDASIPAGGGNNTVVFTLPVGYRPTTTWNSALVWQNATTGTRFGTVNVDTDGTVKWFNQTNTGGNRTAGSLLVPIG